MSMCEGKGEHQGRSKWKMKERVNTRAGDKENTCKRDRLQQRYRQRQDACDPVL